MHPANPEEIEKVIKSLSKYGNRTEQHITCNSKELQKETFRAALSHS